MTITKTKYSHLIDFDLLSDKPTIIDGGACVGGFIDFILEKIKTTQIYAIEPCCRNFKILEEKYEENDMVKKYNAALVGEGYPEKIIFKEFIGLEEWGNVKDLYLNTTHGKLEKIIEYEVDTICLKNIIEENNLSIIDYLKLDIEGCEEEVVVSLSKIHSDVKINQISMEIHKNTNVEKIKQELSKLGYNNIIFKDGELYACSA